MLQTQAGVTCGSDTTGFPSLLLSYCFQVPQSALAICSGNICSQADVAAVRVKTKAQSLSLNTECSVQAKRGLRDNLGIA